MGSDIYISYLYDIEKMSDFAWVPLVGVTQSFTTVEKNKQLHTYVSVCLMSWLPQMLFCPLLGENYLIYSLVVLQFF